MRVLRQEQHTADAHGAISAARASSTVRNVEASTAQISDALLEALLAEAHHRRASYLDASAPIVSALLLFLLVFIGWLT